MSRRATADGLEAPTALGAVGSSARLGVGSASRTQGYPAPVFAFISDVQERTCFASLSGLLRMISAAGSDRSHIPNASAIFCANSLFGMYGPETL